MKNNKSWLSLIIAIWMTLVMSLLSFYILEYIIPFAKNTKNIENSVSSYYQADSWIEEALYSMSWQTNVAYENDIAFPSWNKWFSVDMTASWSSLPEVEKWNSEFDVDFNQIRIWEPIQIEIWNDSINPLTFDIYVKVPDLDKNTSTNEIIALLPSKIINWQLNWVDAVLNSSDSQIEVSDICNSVSTCTKILLSSSDWIKIEAGNESNMTFINFYNSKCWSSKCILKMSIINELKTTIWYQIPFLEWKIINTKGSIPLRYRVIKSNWKANWFRKDLEVKIPQQTLNEAFDFAVFQ